MFLQDERRHYFYHISFLCMIISHALLITRAPKGTTCLERLHIERPNNLQNPDCSGLLHTAHHLGQNHGTSEGKPLWQDGVLCLPRVSTGILFLVLPNQHSFSFLYLSGSTPYQRRLGKARVFFILAISQNELHCDESRDFLILRKVWKIWITPCE